MDSELSERELLFVGKIVALWGSLEHEILCQTLMCLVDNGLPRKLNPMQFSEVLPLWETHVVNKATGERKEVLKKQHRSILHYYDFRNALVHGMWEWSLAAPEKITAVRIKSKKKEVLRTHFTADDLASFASALETINFTIRYPGGFEEWAKEMAERGEYISRRGFCMMTSNPLTDDLLHPLRLKKQETPKE